MKNRAYWEKRSAQRMVSYMDDAESVASEIRKAYEQASQYISNEAETIMRTFQGLSDVSETEARKLLRESEQNISILQQLKKASQQATDQKIRRELVNRINAPAYAARLKRLEQLQKDIEKQCENLYQIELAKTTTHYRELCVEAYQRVIFDIQQGINLGFSFSRMPVSRVNRILELAWSGENYSKRIWHNTTDLARKIKEELLVAFMTGQSYEKTAVRIMEEMGVGASEARRLVRTESCYVANTAEMDSYEECGIEKYRYLATLDKRTSPICQRLDGKEFAVSDGKPGVNMPPMHPWCRSTTIAVFDDDVTDGLTRRARDPETGKTYLVSQDMTYEQWKAQIDTT